MKRRDAPPLQGMQASALPPANLTSPGICTSKMAMHFVPHDQSHPLRLRNCSGSVGSIRNNQCTHTGLITEATGAKASQSFSMADLPCCGQQPVSQHTSCASLPRQGRQLLSGRPRPVPALGGAQPGDQGGGQTTALDAGDPEIS